MNTKLILQLSAFGLVMGFLTVSIIPFIIEPFLWLAIFIYCAFVIANKCKGKYFMHGFLLSLLNCLWLTFIHILFFQKYITNHLDEISMLSVFPIPYSPRIMLLVLAMPLGVFFGIILGTFCVLASKIISRKQV